MASNYYYLKLHYDILDDWKVGTLPDSLKWLFIQCLCVAGEEFNGGLLPGIEQLAFRLRKEPTPLHNDLARLANNGLVELVEMEGEPDRWFVTNYKKRQAKIPPAKKQRGYRNRERQKAIAKSDEAVTGSLPERYDGVTIRNTDKIRSDKIRSDIDGDGDHTPPPLYDDHQENKPNYELISRIAGVVSDTYVPGFDDNLWDAACEVVLAHDAFSKINGFGPWWKANSWYTNSGKASLNHFIKEFKNYLDGVTRTNATDNSHAPNQHHDLIQQLKEDHANAKMDR